MVVYIGFRFSGIVSAQMVSFQDLELFRNVRRWGMKLV